MATDPTSEITPATAGHFDLPGLEPSCQEVEACAGRLLADGFGRLPVRELVRSLEYSRSLATMGRTPPQRSALLRITALSLILLARTHDQAAVGGAGGGASAAAAPAPPPPARPSLTVAPSPFRLQAPARPLDGVDLDGNLLVAADDE